MSNKGTSWIIYVLRLRTNKLFLSLPKSRLALVVVLTIDGEKAYTFPQNKTLSAEIERRNKLKNNTRELWVAHIAWCCSALSGGCWGKAKLNHKLRCYVFILVPFQIAKHHHKRKYFPSIPVLFSCRVTSQQARKPKLLKLMIEYIFIEPFPSYEEKWRRFGKNIDF